MKSGFALSGGAAWGLANIGILQVLEREGFRCDCVAGSSMGAIVAALYALSIPLNVIADVASNISLLKVARIAKSPFSGGFHSGLLRQQLETILVPLMGNAVISDAKIPFVCVAGKVCKPVAWERIVSPRFTEYFYECITPYVFPSGTRMIDALLATSAIPVIFSPMKIGQHEFVDLVHFGALPARVLRTLHAPDIVIGTDTNPRFGRLRRLLPVPWKEFLDHGHREIEADRAVCNLVIEPRMPASMFRFDRASEFIEAGRFAAEKRLGELHALRQNFSLKH